MKIQCPKCRETISVNALGRKPFNVPVTKVYDALRLYRNVSGAANSLGCSRGYIYKVLGQDRMTPKGVIETSGQKNERGS